MGKMISHVLDGESRKTSDFRGFLLGAAYSVQNRPRMGSGLGHGLQRENPRITGGLGSARRGNRTPMALNR
jgi:hypothetical protein